MKRQLSSKKIQSVILGFSFFLYTNPYFTWSLEKVSVLLYFISGVLLFFNSFLVRKKYFLFFILTLTYLSFAEGRNIIGTSLVLSNVFMLALKDKVAREAYRCFYNIYVFFLILSISNFLLFLIGVSMPSHVIEPINEAKNYNYTVYPFLLVPNRLDEVFRFCGLYEEPGNIGTTAILLLGIEKFNLAKWKNIAILIGGLLSLSLFFYLVFFIYLIIYTFLHRVKIRYRILALLFVGSIFYIGSIENSVVSTVIMSRLEYDEDDLIVGNNRSSKDLNIYYESIRWKEPIFYLGSSFANANKKNLSADFGGSAGYKTAIIKYGIIGLFLYLLFFFFYAKKVILKKFDFNIFMLSFLLVLYQRPFLLDLNFLYLFITWIHFCNKNNLYNLEYNIVKNNLQR